MSESLILIREKKKTSTCRTGAANKVESYKARASRNTLFSYIILYTLTTSTANLIQVGIRVLLIPGAVCSPDCHAIVQSLTWNYYNLWNSLYYGNKSNRIKINPEDPDHNQFRKAHFRKWSYRESNPGPNITVQICFIQIWFMFFITFLLKYILVATVLIETLDMCSG